MRSQRGLGYIYTDKIRRLYLSDKIYRLFLYKGVIMNYKDTLLMPKTVLSMKANLPNKEPQIFEKWYEGNHTLYHEVLKKNEGKQKYILADGPPYANGDIHVGHALNKILKDIVVRYKNMNGFYAPYIPGWDTHGLPIEQALTKKGIKRKEYEINAYRALCASYADEQISRQKEQFLRLGLMGDYSNPYITKQPKYEAKQIEVFADMVDRGLIYRGAKPVYWSPSSESALAESEIEYQEKTSPAIYVAFDVVKGNNVVAVGDRVIIWTTTPWTIPANRAVTFHPNESYVRVDVEGTVYIIAEKLLEKVSEKLEWINPLVQATFIGKDIEFAEVQHPLYDRTSLCIIAEYVTMEDGTGVVHSAPGHGEDDYQATRKYNLVVESVLNEQGVMNAYAPRFEGLFYEQANKAIGEELEQHGSLLNLTFIKHQYPHDWRTKKPVVFRATPQWFASIEQIKDELLVEVDNVTWHTAWGKVRLSNMLRDRSDWCISRQRAWGVPLPIFYTEDETPILEKEIIYHVAQIIEQEGTDAWYTKTATELLPEGYKHPKSPNNIFTKEMDIMDVWFDSGTSHTGNVLRNLGVYPADLYLEGSDQYRGWFNSSIITGTGVYHKAPYREVLSHGFVLDEKGNKMSKSLGNVVDPLKVTKQYGADILRLWVSSVDYKADVRISDNILKQVSESYRKIRNTLRFLHGNIFDFTLEEHEVKLHDMHEVDQYMMHRLSEIQHNTLIAYEKFEFKHVYDTILNFAIKDLSTFYFDFAKDILYVEAANSPRRRSIQTVMYYQLHVLLKLLAPILPHTAEEVYLLTDTPKKSIFLEDIEKLDIKISSEIIEKFTKLQDIRTAIQKSIEPLRAEKQIGRSLDVEVQLWLSEEYAILKTLEDLEIYFIVSKLSLIDSLEKGDDYSYCRVHVQKFDGKVCERCKKLYDTLATEELCLRCSKVISEGSY